MGDKGKKDKDKSQKQKVQKQEQTAKKKQDKKPRKTPQQKSKYRLLKPATPDKGGFDNGLQKDMKSIHTIYRRCSQVHI